MNVLTVVENQPLLVTTHGRGTKLPRGQAGIVTGEPGVAGLAPERGPQRHGQFDRIIPQDLDAQRDRLVPAAARQLESAPTGISRLLGRARATAPPPAVTG